MEKENIQEPTNTETTVNIDYDKLADVLEKRTNRTADGVLKGYLKEQGLTGDELNNAIQNYKSQQAKKAQDEKDSIANMKAENESLKAQILNSTIDTKIHGMASSEGISSEKMPFLLKLIDRKELVDDKGQILDDKIKQKLEEVIKAFPDFKQNKQQNGFQVGVNDDNQSTQTDVLLDKIFGVGKK